MLGARGCISYDAATELTNSGGATIAGTGVQTIAVAWQGITPTLTSPNSCGTGLYPSEPQRRVVTATLRIGALKAL